MASLLLQIAVDAFLLGGVYTLMSVGLSLAFGVTRIINFAHGEVLMFGAYASFFAFAGLGIDPLLSLPAIAILGGLGGYVLFKSTLERILGDSAINMVLLTFGIGLVMQNLAVIMWTGDERSANPSYAFASWFLSDDVVIARSRLIAFAVATLFILALLAWLRWSELGRATRAVSQNRAAASLMGINVQAIYALSFALSSALGAATGGIMSFLAEIGLLSILILFRRREGKELAAAGLVVVLAIALVSWLGIGRALERFASYKTLEVSEGRRIEMLQGTWRIFLDHPIAGTGLGTLQEVFPLYETIYDGLIVNHSHNDYAEALAETGVIGGLCGLVFLVLLVWTGWKNIVAEKEVMNLAYHAGALVACFGLLIHATVDFNFHIPSNALIFLLQAALATSPALRLHLRP